MNFIVPNIFKKGKTYASKRARRYARKIDAMEWAFFFDKETYLFTTDSTESIKAMMRFGKIIHTYEYIIPKKAYSHYIIAVEDDAAVTALIHIVLIHADNKIPIRQYLNSKTKLDEDETANIYTLNGYTFLKEVPELLKCRFLRGTKAQKKYDNIIKAENPEQDSNKYLNMYRLRTAIKTYYAINKK